MSLQESLETTLDSEATLKEECRKQAEIEDGLVEDKEEAVNRLHDLQGVLSSTAQSLAVARVRATAASLAEIEVAMMKGQMSGLLRLLRLRRELHHGATTSLAPPTAKELLDYIEYLGVADISRAERIRYGGDIKAGIFRLRVRTETVQTADGTRFQYKMLPVDRSDSSSEDFKASPIAIDPWATRFSVDQSHESNKGAPLEFPVALFQPSYFIDGHETDFPTYSSLLETGDYTSAHVVCKAASGFATQKPGVLPCAFAADCITLYLDPLNGSDHNDGSEHSPFRSMLHAAEAAANADYVKDVRVHVCGSNSSTTAILTLHNAILAVIAEEALYAPLPDGWERSRDGRGRVYYHNKWLANRAPSYEHPLDETFRELCTTLEEREVAVARQCQQTKAQLQKLPKYPATVRPGIDNQQYAALAEGGGDGASSSTEVEAPPPGAQPSSKGGDLHAFLAEASLTQFEAGMRQLGATLPEHLRDIDGAALKKLGLAPLERTRFERIIATSFRPPTPVVEEDDDAVAREAALQAASDVDTDAAVEKVLDRQIVVVGAKGLAKQAGVGKGKLDPYAIVLLDDVEVGKTKVAQKTLDPAWEATFQIKVPQGGTTGEKGEPVALRIEVYDHKDGTAGHDFMGELELALPEVCEDEQPDMTFPLQAFDLTGKGGQRSKKVQGALTLVMDDPNLVRPTVKRELILAGARDLVASDRSLMGKASSDPYAVIFWNDAKVAVTPVRAQTLEPEWETRVVLTIPNRGGDLRVEVFDHDVGSAHDFLGEVRVRLGCHGEWPGDDEELLMSPTQFPLKLKDGTAEHTRSTDQISGSVLMRLENPLIRKLVVLGATGIRAADRARRTLQERKEGVAAKRTSDPYGIVYWNDVELGQTPVATRTLDPEWNAEFELTIDAISGHGTLRIDVFDHDAGSKADFLGQLEIVLGDNMSGDSYGGPEVLLARRVFALQPRPENPTERIPGSIAIRVDPDPDGPQMSAEALEGLLAQRPVTPRGMFEVTILEGKNLKKMDLIGKNDPYVLVTVNGETRQSSTCDGGGSKPVWGVDNAGETLRFEVETALSVEVACLDEDEGSSDDMIGTAIIELDHQPEGEDWAMEEWFEISDAKEKITGSLHLLLSWSNPRASAE